MLDQIIMAELWRLNATYTFTTLSGIVGDVDPNTRHVRVAQGMTPVETRSTIMHELGHLDLMEFPTPDITDEEYAEMEAHADQWAAKKLITAPMLAWAQAIARDPREQAEMLGVDPNIITARIRAVAGLTVPPLAQVIPVRSVRIV